MKVLYRVIPAGFIFFLSKGLWRQESVVVIPEVDWSEMDLPDPMVSCLLSLPAKEEHEQIQKREMVAVVQTVSPKRVNKQYDLATAAMRCYCKKTGCLHFQNVIHEDLYKPLHFFSARWISIIDRFWHVADWIVAVDSDTIPVDMSRSLQDWLGRKEHDGKDVILHVRRNYEVIAGFVALRTSSPFARCFVEYWANMNTQEQNYDNGDLLLALMQLYKPELARECAPLRGTNWKQYKAGYTMCFTKLYPTLMTDSRYPIKVYFPLEGIWNTYNYTTTLAPKDKHRIYNYCLDGDIFIHGDTQKLIANQFVDMSSYRCQGFESRTNQCQWLNRKETRTLAAKCCYWHYPGCLDDTGRNVCEASRHCQSPIGSLGIGLQQCKWIA